MPAKRSAMRKIKEILRLKFEVKFSHERMSGSPPRPVLRILASLNAPVDDRHSRSGSRKIIKLGAGLLRGPALLRGARLQRAPPRQVIENT
jgi:hypothetical protein